MSDTTHGPHTPGRPFGRPVGSSPLTGGLSHPVNECGPSCETNAPTPPYADDSWTQKSSIQSEPYTFLTHLNRKLDRLVNERRKLDAMRNTLQSDIDVLHQLIRISS